METTYKKTLKRLLIMLESGQCSLWAAAHILFDFYEHYLSASGIAKKCLCGKHRDVFLLTVAFTKKAIAERKVDSDKSVDDNVREIILQPNPDENQLFKYVMSMPVRISCGLQISQLEISNYEKAFQAIFMKLIATGNKAWFERLESAIDHAATPPKTAIH